MDIILDDINLSLPGFLLVFIRISSLFVSAPFWGRRNFPNVFKLSLALFISFLVFPIVGVEYASLPYNWLYLFLVIKELLIGLSFGFIALAIFSSLYLAGQFIDMIMGFGIVNVIDPQSNIQVPLIGNFIYLLTIIIYLSINGHHYLLSALIQSFHKIPYNTIIVMDRFLDFAVLLITSIFSLAFRISLPVVAAVFLVDIGLGIVARTVPQMNVFIVGMPIKIFIGFLVILLILPIFSQVLGNILYDIYRVINNFIELFAVG